MLSELAPRYPYHEKKYSLPEHIYIISYSYIMFDRLCGLVVRVLGYRSEDPGSIPGTTRKKSSGSGTGCTQPREYKLRSYLIEK
jgi:hypothetical protein